MFSYINHLILKRAGIRDARVPEFKRCSLKCKRDDAPVPQACLLNKNEITTNILWEKTISLNRKRDDAPVPQACLLNIENNNDK